MEQEGMEPQEPTKPEGSKKSSAGPVVGIIIIIIVIILGGYYFLSGTDEPAPVDDGMTDTGTTSDEVPDIEADLDSTDVDDLDADLSDLDAEFDALEQELENI